ncbi:CatA-like O-acetyltransferase [Lutibacter sp. A80]|uniref:CatA-like O-acetyltransferase n=1 Tax=Lutibacter sp. A80 TaxID=2918453 RepID=UPI001F06B6DC|nr:CatA-like O-acetyltransferase [Lutibacter sp. A80]UMB60489.1 CatA-like O-acetyltransferase [Lutibacter sp. A80]
MKEFSIENWKRKAQFDFFKSYEDPFFNITVNLDVTKLYKFCKKNNLSFSLACIYVALKSINEVPEFKLRIYKNKVYIFDEVHIGSTILNEDNTFSFCNFPFKSTIFDFDISGKKIIETHKKGVTLGAQENELGIVHCSILPWFTFTSIKHARKGDEKNKGIPKIVFGSLFKENKQRKIPFSVEAHHALLDGFHVSQLLSKMQVLINELD